MSEIITSKNLDMVIEKNKVIKTEVDNQVLKFKMNSELMGSVSIPQLAFQILHGFGLIQIPVEDKYWSGAIYVKEGKIIPVINTDLPRANQYFTAWHEVYHLLFDDVSFDHIIGADNSVEERKAEYFAAKMLLSGVGDYFSKMADADFVERIFVCMSVFQAPYKAVMVSLYEHAVQSGNISLRDKIKDYFDNRFDDLTERFRILGLDDGLVRPSYVINTSYLQERINQQKELNPDLKYHNDNNEFLKEIKKELSLLTRKNR